MTKPLWQEADDWAEQQRIQTLAKKNLRPDGKTPVSPVPGVSPGFPFGAHPHPPNHYANPQNRHTGVDFPGRSGARIVSLTAGVVIRADWGYDYGNWTQIRDDDGRVWVYCHQSWRVIKAGQRVTPNQLIGYVGATGHAYGPHLHLELSLHSTWVYNRVVNPIGRW